MAGLIYSSWRQNNTGWGDVVTSLGWPLHLWENVQVQRLAANLDRYDLVLLFNGSNTENFQSLIAHRDQWLRFMKRGGVIVAFGIQESKGNWDWIPELGSNFSFDLQTFRGFQTNSDWKNPEAELDLGRIEARWAEFKRWSDQWIVANRNGNDRPIVIYQKVGNGLIVVSTSYGGDRARILDRIWTFSRRSAEASPLGIRDVSWNETQFGRNEVDLTIQNRSQSAINFKIISTNLADEAKAAVHTDKVGIGAGEERTLSLPYHLYDGDNNVDLVLK
ncbi:MAG: hypothetical protein QGH33_04365, partial [Pirellulaceae bacterium]|nr:hypothetical protein [Pirellulaceae bacterium]